MFQMNSRMSFVIWSVSNDFFFSDGRYYEVVKANFERADRMTVVRTLTNCRVSNYYLLSNYKDLIFNWKICYLKYFISIHKYIRDILRSALIFKFHLYIITIIRKQVYYVTKFNSYLYIYFIYKSDIWNNNLTQQLKYHYFSPWISLT